MVGKKKQAETENLFKALVVLVVLYALAERVKQEGKKKAVRKGVKNA